MTIVQSCQKLPHVTLSNKQKNSGINRITREMLASVSHTLTVKHSLIYGCRISIPSTLKQGNNRLTILFFIFYGKKGAEFSLFVINNLSLSTVTIKETSIKKQTAPSSSHSPTNIPHLWSNSSYPTTHVTTTLHGHNLAVLFRSNPSSKIRSYPNQ